MGLLWGFYLVHSLAYGVAVGSMFTIGQTAGGF